MGAPVSLEVEPLLDATDGPFGDLGGLETAGVLVELDFRRGSCGRVLDFPALARTDDRVRPPLVVLLREGREHDSDGACKVELEDSSDRRWSAPGGCLTDG
jgi:hypothetical protein